MTAGDDGTARIWDADSGAPLDTLRGGGRSVYSAAFSPNGERVVTGGWYGTVRIWDADSGAELETLGARGVDGASSVASAPMASESWPSAARATCEVWDAASGAELETLLPRGRVLSAAFSPDGERVVTAGGGGTVRIWDAASGAELETLRGHRGIVWSAASAPTASG